MSERFLNNPNLPENKVTTVFTNIDDIALKNAFDKLSIKVVQVAENSFIDTPISRHADILANYVGKSTFLSDKNQTELCNFIEDNSGKTIIIENIKSPYPNDCLLNFADIGDYVYQPVKTYSSGMFVRLAFAVAINIEPEILIVDEALSVGDVFFQAKCYHKFDEFKKMGKTILFVSHDLSSIAKYCDRVVLLNQGHKLGEGSPKEMIDAYKQVLVGQYEVPEEEDSLLEDEDINELAAEVSDGHKKRKKRVSGEVLGVNPDALEYGTKAALIHDYYVTDKKGTKASAIIKGEEFTLHYKVKFEEDVPAPIFAFTIKNVRGTEITGTNSMFEKAFLSDAKKGEVKEVTFTQNMDLQGGEYLLSLGVTGYEKE